MSESASETEPATPTLTSSKAVVALVFGIASFVGVCFTALPAIFLALFALRDINQSEGRLAGQGLAELAMLLAVVGTITGISVALLLTPGGWLNPFPPPAANQANLRLIGQAMQGYLDENEGLPQVGSAEEEGQLVRYCWRVALLPHLGEAGLYQKFRLDEPWDSQHNSAYLDYMPRVYQLPGQEDPKRGQTHYRVFAGPKMPFRSFPADNPDWKEVQAKAAHTALVVVATESVPWTKPESLVYHPAAELPALGGHFQPGAVLTAELQVRPLTAEFEPSLWRALLEIDAEKQPLRELWQSPPLD